MMKKTYIKPEMIFVSVVSNNIMLMGSVYLRDSDGNIIDRGPITGGDDEEEDVEQASKGNGLWDDDEWDD